MSSFRVLKRACLWIFKVCNLPIFKPSNFQFFNFEAFEYRNLPILSLPISNFSTFSYFRVSEFSKLPIFQFRTYYTVSNLLFKKITEIVGRLLIGAYYRRIASRIWQWKSLECKSLLNVSFTHVYVQAFIQVYDERSSHSFNRPFRSKLRYALRFYRCTTCMLGSGDQLRYLNDLFCFTV